VVTDRTVLENPSGELAASTAAYAVLAVPRPGVASWPNGPQPGTVDLNTGALRVYDLGLGTTYCILRSPDPTKLLVCQQYPPSQTTLILDLHSHVVKGLVGASGFTSKPIGWTQRGIFFASCEATCLNGGASVLDPQTSAVMRITGDGYVSGVSPSGSFLGGAKNMYLGDSSSCNDSIFSIQLDWTTASGVPQGSWSPLVSQPNKDFKVLDIADDGSLLYTESDCPPNGHSSPSPTSLYYFSGGRSTLQFGLGETADVFYMAAPQSPGLLLGRAVAVVARRPNGISEIDLVHLCTSDGCQPTVTTIAQGDRSIEGYAFSVLP